jgi:hypothetical protein
MKYKEIGMNLETINLFSLENEIRRRYPAAGRVVTNRFNNSIEIRFPERWMVATYDGSTLACGKKSERIVWHDELILTLVDWLKGYP